MGRMNFCELPGYNANKFVKDEHVFVPGKGCFFETPDKARQIYRQTATGNGVNFAMTTVEICGLTVYNYNHTNVFD